MISILDNGNIHVQSVAASHLVAHDKKSFLGVYCTTACSNCDAILEVEKNDINGSLVGGELLQRRTLRHKLKSIMVADTKIIDS